MIYSDELKKELYQQWFMDILLTQRNSKDMFYALAQKIDEQPTAYYVDKVVEQLNNLKRYSNPYDSYYEEASYRATEFENSVVNRLIDDVIKIVKAGGRDER